MRLYTFTHYMLSPIAKGIQSGHATTELFVKYNDPKEQDTSIKEIEKGLMVFDWARDHKTHIALNGGTSPDLQEIVDILTEICDYPWADFNEDESLGGLRTSIAMVIPEKIYTIAELVRNKILIDVEYGYRVNSEDDVVIYDAKLTLNRFIISDKDKKLIDYINNFRLMGV